MRRVSPAILALVSVLGARGSYAQQEAQLSEWETFSRTVLGFTDLVGHISVDKFSYWSFPSATNLRSRLKITDTGWRFENITADYCGGTANAEAAIEETKDGREFRVVAEFLRVDLEEFTRQFKYSVTPGRLTGRMRLRITTDGLQGLDGSAEIHARDTNLGQLPVMLKAFTFLSHPSVQKEKLSEVDAHMTLTPRGIVFQSLSLRSKSGSFSLEADRLGSMSYEGALDFRFKPIIPSKILQNVPFFGPLANDIVSELQQGIMRARVTGTIYEPEVKWTPFR